MKRKEQDFLHKKAIMSLLNAFRRAELLFGMRSLLFFFALFLSVTFYSCKYTEPKIDKEEIYKMLK